MEKIGRKEENNREREEQLERRGKKKEIKRKSKVKQEGMKGTNAARYNIPVTPWETTHLTGGDQGTPAKLIAHTKVMATANQSYKIRPLRNLVFREGKKGIS